MSGHNSEFKIFTLHVEGINIDNVSLEDIGNYLTDFSELLGSDAFPRYHSIKRGSLTIAAKVRADREIDVKTRGFLLRTGDAPEDAVRAEQRLSRRLGYHRARRATILDASRTKVVEIPIEKPVAVVIPDVPSLTRAGSLQGKIIRLGGRQEIVSVDIQDVDGHVYVCKAKRDVAKKLAREIFDRTVRVHGTGRWKRGTDGIWYVEDFVINDFELLDDDALTSVVDELRKIPAAWKDHDDSFAELRKIQHGEDSEP